MADPINPGSTPGMPPLRSDNAVSDPKAKREQSAPHENQRPSAQQESKTGESNIYNIANNDTDQKEMLDTPDSPDQSRSPIRSPQNRRDTTLDPALDYSSEDLYEEMYLGTRITKKTSISTIRIATINAASKLLKQFDNLIEYGN